MTTVSDAVALVAGSASTIRPPSAPGQLAGVVIQNLSPLYCSVTLGGSAYALPPYTADLYPLSGLGTPVTLVPVSLDPNSAGLSANAVAVWYGADELPDSASYPAGLTPPQKLEIVGNVDATVSGSVAVSGGSLTASISGPVNLAAGSTVDVSGGVIDVSGSVISFDLTHTQLWTNAASPGANQTKKSAVLDVGLYQSLYVSAYHTSFGANYGDIFLVTAVWYSDAAGTQQIDSDNFTFVVTGGQDPQIVMRVPIRARYCVVSIAAPKGNGATPAFAFAFGSSMTVPNTLLRAIPGAQIGNGNIAVFAPMLAQLSGLTIANGASSSFYVPPVRETVRVVFGTAAAALGKLTAQLDGLFIDSTNTPQWAQLGSVDSNTGSDYAGMGLNAPSGMAMRVTVINNDTSPRIPSVTVWDTSDF